MSILVIGGTTEGREAAAVLDEAGAGFVYSTLTGLQQVDMHHGRAISGAMSADDVVALAPRMVVDAAHPYAVSAHRMAVDGARKAGVPVVRYERPPLSRLDGVTYCAGYDAAMEAMEADGVERLLALTGVRTIGRLKPWWLRHSDTVFRVLDRDESRQEALDAGFDTGRLCYYTGAEGETASLIGRYRPDAIITKDSGRAGGFTDKVNAALGAGVKVYVVERPALPDGYTATVYGPVGLRRAVQTLVPGFFGLRTGLTTGTTATATAIAAARRLAGERIAGSVTVTLPSGEPVEVPVVSCDLIEPGHARAVAIKDGGDDPDVTNGLEIIADVRIVPEHTRVVVTGGEGVGRVTLPGLGIAVGDAAINPVPRSMIAGHVGAILSGHGVEVTVSVPHGREVAARTFNPRLGVVDGLSIIGTSGVVRPFSNEAFVESLRRQIAVAVAARCSKVVLNSGAKSENRLRELCPDLPDVAFIHYGNLVGEAVKASAEAGLDEIVVGVMIGKLVKLAAGHLDTHSSGVVMSHDFLLEVGRESGLSERSLNAIKGLKLARTLWSLLDGDGCAQRFYDALVNRAYAVLQPLAGRSRLRIHLIPDS